MHKKITLRLIPALLAVTFSGGAFAAAFQLTGLSAGLGLQPHDLDLAMRLDGLRWWRVLQTGELLLTGHEQGWQALRGQRQHMVGQRHPAVKVHLLIGRGIAQYIDGVLHEAG